ncbi:hypothetical protein HPB49_022989 [Dermacentor silvarum]|uniref:Uncharacterized protein n=1 Tax=Dermacentor silvarum TaxID=543639 RepID=A0ACB8DRB9_DERSI|nr:hypothetical protein HPB49_022989 [Dermacentor silvarum]
MDRMLEHYENECTFHSVECLRCGDVVQHSDLPTHYVAGCIAGVSSAITKYRSSEHTALTLEGMSAALKDLTAMLGAQNHDQLLPVIQSQLNELTEQVRNQEASFGKITRELRASEQNLKDEMAQIAAVITSTVPHQPNPAAEASTSSSLSLRSEKALILRKLEHFTYLSLSALEHLRQTSPPPDSSRVIAYCNPSSGRTQRLISALSTTPARIREIGRWLPPLCHVMAAGSDAMADAEGRAFHRLRNYPAAGINWRPTRFVEPVPSSRVCSVCGTIPSLTASLPCLHSICDSCIRISRQDGRNVCPLDREPFVEHECSWNVFAESEMRNLRAHCWNVPWGCEFVGDMEAVLRHYEEECTFHALECPHCRTAVRPTNLLTHCTAVGADSASPERTSEPSLVRRGGQTARGMNVPLEELVALMRGAGRDELAIIQTLLNELLERASNFGSCLSEVARDVAALRHNPVDATAVAPSGNSSALVSYGVDSAINLHQGNSGVAHAAGTSTSIEPSNEVALRMLASYCSVSLSAVKDRHVSKTCWCRAGQHNSSSGYFIRYAVPTIFPNCPSYLSKVHEEEKRTREQGNKGYLCEKDAVDTVDTVTRNQTSAEQPTAG